MSASASASTAPSRPRKLQTDTISSVLLDRRRRVVRRTVLIPIVLIVQRLFQHSVGQSAHMLANALHSSHQRSHRPGVQRRRARCVGFGRAEREFSQKIPVWPGPKYGLSRWAALTSWYSGGKWLRSRERNSAHPDQGSGTVPFFWRGSAGRSGKGPSGVCQRHRRFPMVQVTGCTARHRPCPSLAIIAKSPDLFSHAVNSPTWSLVMQKPNAGMNIEIVV